MHKTILLLFFSFFSLQAQRPNFLSGTVQNLAGETLIGVEIFSSDRKIGCLSDAEGHYKLDIRALNDSSLITIKYIGYHSQSHTLVKLLNNNTIHLKEDRLGLEEVVVSANRKAIASHRAPIMVNRINNRLLQDVQALSLAEGLSFSPGLRVENNCQSCGFTQLRINGLDGAYSQVLVNSRPIFSALMGVYGLEMFPPSMIERVEVVKGAASAIYGASAIGGTLNIITKEAQSHGIDISTGIKLIGASALEQNQQMAASVVNKDYSSGAYLFAFRRKRDHFDANNDGFSELPKLENISAGLDAYWKASSRKKLRYNVFWMQEGRRGGSDFNLLPHQSRVAEDLQHQVLGAGLSYEWTDEKLEQFASFYSSAQQVFRNSYYGAGGRVLGPNDSLSSSDILALNAYGNSRDINWVNGFQYSYQVKPLLKLSLGAEQQHNAIVDNMPGYNRNISQRVNSLGSFLQSQWFLSSELEVLAGLRFDHLQLNSQYRFVEGDQTTARNFNIASPRLNLKYDINPHASLRTGYSRGFRAPQAFNEDLHIETVGGAALFVELDPNLKTEFSHSFNLSYSLQKEGKKSEQQFIAESFYTILENPFILSEQRALSNGTALITKRNGKGAMVYGINLEYNYAYADWLVIRSGLSMQRNRYQEAELIWQNPDSSDDQILTEDMLRSPELYGFFNLKYSLNPKLDFNANLSYSGPMLVPHVINPETERTVLKRSPDFFDFGLIADFRLLEGDDWQVELNAGVQNIFNAYQSDFDRGAERDASYIYGPLQPRTIIIGLRLKI